MGDWNHITNHTALRLLRGLVGGWNVLRKSHSSELSPHLRKCLQLNILPRGEYGDGKPKFVRERRLDILLQVGFSDLFIDSTNFY